MKNKVISLLCIILSGVCLFLSINTSLNVIKGVSTIGNFFSAVIITSMLGLVFAISAGYYLMKKSEKFKKISKKSSLLTTIFSIGAVLVMFVLTIPNIIDEIVVGNIDRLIALHLILNVFTFVLGFISGIFLSRVIHNKDEIKQLNKNVDIKFQNGNLYRYILSFLIPFVGYILGAILLSKDDNEEKRIGKNCIICGIISAILSVSISIVFFVL